MLAKLTVSNRSQLAIILNKKNLLNSQQVKELYRKEPIIKLLLECDWASEKAIRDILRRKLLVEEVSPAEFQIDAAVASLIPRSFCERQLVVPLRLEGKCLLLALTDPMDIGLLDDLRFASGLEIQPAMANVAAIKAKLAEMYGEKVDFRELETRASSPDPYEGIEVVIEEEASESLEDLLCGTDESLVSRLKVMAEMDISERRRPQDDRIAVKTPMRIVDLCISTLPTINGEEVVMRVLDRNSAIVDLDGLGFSKTDLAKILNMVDKQQGLILATAPTGSGKTTRLYALLQHNATSSKNYVTTEGPVEYCMDQASQVLIKEKSA